MHNKMRNKKVIAVNVDCLDIFVGGVIADRDDSLISSVYNRI